MKTAHAQQLQPSPRGTRKFRRFLAAVESLSIPAQYAITAVLIFVVFTLDFITGAEIAFSIFYLAPVSLLAWHRGLRAACVGAVICTAAWLLADVLNLHVYSNPSIQYWNALVRGGFFFVVAIILVQLRNAVDEEQRLARTDTLTGAANSRSFLEIAAAEVARQHRYHHPLSIAFLDCDNFKEVNDEYGHVAGDELLRRIASTIQRELRKVDVVARLGGDEFAVLLPESGERAAAIAMAKVSAALKTALADYAVTFSVGIVTYCEPPQDVEALIHSADRAMYDAKNAGKNTSRHYVIDAKATRTAEGP